MRRIGVAAFCLMLLSASVAQAEIRAAVFNLQQVVAESDVLKEAQAALKKEFEPRRIALEKEGANLQKLAEPLGNGSATEQQRKNFLARQQAHGQKTNEYLTDAQQAKQRVQRDVDMVVVRAAESYAQKKGYDLILDNAAAIYSGGLPDVTNDMLSETNALWRASKKK